MRDLAREREAAGDGEGRRRRPRRRAPAGASARPSCSPRSPGARCSSTCSTPWRRPGWRTSSWCWATRPPAIRSAVAWRSERIGSTRARRTACRARSASASTRPPRTPRWTRSSWCSATSRPSGRRSSPRVLAAAEASPRADRPRPLRRRRRAQPGARAPRRLGARRRPLRRSRARAPARGSRGARRRGGRRRRQPRHRHPGGPGAVSTDARPRDAARARGRLGRARPGQPRAGRAPPRVGHAATSTRPVSALFVADPRRTGEPTLELLRAMARPDETWLDIGAGAGRYALPLALRVRQVIAVEPSAGMRRALRTGIDEHGLGNVRVVAGTWPESLALLEPLPAADVSLIAHVGYDIEEIGPFLDAMEDATRDRCVAVLTDRSPASVADPFWPLVHGEDRVAAAGHAGPPGAAPRPRPRDGGRPRRALAAHVRLGRRAHRVPAPPAVHHRGRREGPSLPGHPARP